MRISCLHHSSACIGMMSLPDTALGWPQCKRSSVVTEEKSGQRQKPVKELLSISLLRPLRSRKECRRQIHEPPRPKRLVRRGLSGFVRLAFWPDTSIAPIFPEQHLWHAAENERSDQNCHSDQIPAVRSERNHAYAVEKCRKRRYQEERTGDVAVDSPAATGVGDTRSSHYSQGACPDRGSPTPADRFEAARHDGNDRSEERRV